LTNTSLHQCFQLLLDAHYQTTPNDLKMLLDDPTHNLLLQRRGETLVGVAWLADEGQLSAPLSEAVYRGTRRPAGNLLAQSLAYYLRDQQAAQAKLVRVVRIAVAPEHQRTELGSRLLRVCVEQADACGADAIGTSFGLSPELARFWQRSGFAPVRVGSKRDTVSGRYSALFVRPLTASWSDKVDRWAELLRYHLEPLLLQVSLPVAVVEALAGNDTALAPPADYRDFAWHVIADFAQGYLDFASVQPVLARALTAYPAAPSLLLHAANSQRSLTEDAKQMGFHGRKDYVQTLRQLSDQLLKRAR
jgi:tRNA(Met) cytidine acetyltransferase